MFLGIMHSLLVFAPLLVAAAHLALARDNDYIDFYDPKEYNDLRDCVTCAIWRCSPTILDVSRFCSSLMSSCPVSSLNLQRGTLNLITYVGYRLQDQQVPLPGRHAGERPPQGPQQGP